jgi:hypothetical protein
VLTKLDPATPLFQQQRPCDCCGKIITPKDTHAGLQRFCDQVCSARWWMRIPERKAKFHSPEARAKSGRGRSAFLRSGTPEANAQVERIRKLNPTNRPEVRAKLSARLREMKHKPPIQGGNGRPLPVPQQRLLDVLGPEWVAELPVSLGGRFPGYPTNYKLDLALPRLKLGIEVDGQSHNTDKARKRDAKKDGMLVSLGWTVLRFSNRAILTWINAGMPTDDSISMTLRSHGILPSASAAA